MLNSELLHPQILASLGRAGHSSRVLIADGNYPFSTTLGPNAELVSLNLSPGVVSVNDTLRALAASIPIEAAHVMDYATTGPFALESDPPAWSDYTDILSSAGQPLELQRIERFAFYETARAADVALVIATADQALYANLLLTIGVRR